MNPPDAPTGPDLLSGAMTGAYHALSAWPGMTVTATPELAYSLTTTPYPLFNCVTRSPAPGPLLAAAIGTVARAARAVRPRGVPMLWWRFGEDGGETDIFRTHGFALGGACPAMIRDLGDPLPTGPPALPDGASLSEVGDSETLAAWNDLAAEVFLFPDFAARAMLAMYLAVGLGPDAPWRHVLLGLDGRPAAVASVFARGRTAVIANVGAAPEARGRGLGAAATLAVLDLARRAGATAAVLLSSDMAQGLYARLGFRPFGGGRFYVLSPGRRG